MLKATLNFPDQQSAKAFTSAWACHTLTGHDMSAVKNDGSVSVTVYNVDNDRKYWIDNYIADINK